MNRRIPREPVVRVVGRAPILASITNGNQIDSLVLNDSLSANLTALSDLYGLYRFTRLKVVLPPNLINGTQTPTIYGVAFTPEPLLTNPTTYAEAVAFPYWIGQGTINNGSTFAGVAGTHQSFTVDPSDLRKVGVKWFRTQGKGTEADWETQGTLIFAASDTAGATATKFRLWAEYEVEFTDQLPAAVTLSRMSVSDDPRPEKTPPSRVAKQLALDNRRRR